MKHVHRFFVSRPVAAGQRVCLGKEDSFHAARVLRLKAGDRLELAGSDGRVFFAEVCGVEDLVQATVVNEITGNADGAELVVAQALPQGRKLEMVVEKLSEIGAARLVPLYTEKSVIPRIDGATRKLERWRRIARSAAQQSRRPSVMDVDEPVDIGSWLAVFTGPVIALATETAGFPLGEAVAGVKPPLALLVGPEAGFSDAEIILLKDAGACFASLGAKVLRTETAALVAASIALHRLGKLG